MNPPVFVNPLPTVTVADCKSDRGRKRDQECLVHDGTTIRSRAGGDSATACPLTLEMFIGTPNEVNAEIERLGLVNDDPSLASVPKAELLQRGLGMIQRADPAVAAKIRADVEAAVAVAVSVEPVEKPAPIK
jgi:hypothetical protein